MKYTIGELIYFSPTGTTKQIVESIAEGFGSTSHQHLDATFKDVLKNETFSDNEICVIGSPVYAGRLPSTFLTRISHIYGNGRYAVLVVVYGNRDFEDALVELFDFAIAHNFKPIATAAFIGEHSYSTSAFPLSQGRPDSIDSTKAIYFGSRIVAKVNSGNTDIVLIGTSIPGNRPYKPITTLLNVAPATDLELCTKCQICVSVCPVHAISVSNPAISDDNKCIRCSACIKKCPETAKSMKDERIVEITKRLFTGCKNRKEPVIIM